MYSIPSFFSCKKPFQKPTISTTFWEKNFPWERISGLVLVLVLVVLVVVVVVVVAALTKRIDVS